MLFGKFGVLCFLETPVLRFALLPITIEAIFEQSMNNLSEVATISIIQCNIMASFLKVSKIKVYSCFAMLSFLKVAEECHFKVITKNKDFRLL